ncbi:hypothetical protein ABID97_001944 [Variovorax sp. OAS795]|uniref:SPRY domain-containing protein n=1 Tax=Variovorax sp. OAS795 TaxID=3034231 RepID=UPI0033948211
MTPFKAMSLAQALTGGVATTWNPSDKSANITLSLANLRASGNGSAGSARATVSKASGKWQFEVTARQTGGSWLIGVGKIGAGLTSYPGSDVNGYGYHAGNGNKYNNGSPTAFGTSLASGDVLGVTIDFATLALVFYKNGVLVGTAFTVSSGTYFPMIGAASGTGALGDLNTGTLAYPVGGFTAWN